MDSPALFYGQTLCNVGRVGHEIYCQWNFHWMPCFWTNRLQPIACNLLTFQFTTDVQVFRVFGRNKCRAWTKWLMPLQKTCTVFHPLRGLGYTNHNYIYQFYWLNLTDKFLIIWYLFQCANENKDNRKIQPQRQSPIIINKKQDSRA